jgi:putative oxidoreductase
MWWRSRRRRSSSRRKRWGRARAGGTSLAQFLTDFPSAAGLSTDRMTPARGGPGIVVLLASGATRNVNGSDYVIDGDQAKAA